VVVERPRLFEPDGGRTSKDVDNKPGEVAAAERAAVGDQFAESSSENSAAPGQA